MTPVCLFLWKSPSLSLSLNIPLSLRRCYDSKDGVCEEQEGAWRKIVLGASWIEGRRELKKGLCFRKVAWRDRHQPPFGLHSDLPVSPATLMVWGGKHQHQSKQVYCPDLAHKHTLTHIQTPIIKHTWPQQTSKREKNCYVQEKILNSQFLKMESYYFFFLSPQHKWGKL